MPRHDLGKRTALDRCAAAGQSSRVTSLRATALMAVALACLDPGRANAQQSIASDLWRVAAGTLVVPPALASDGSAALWTPAATLEAGGATFKLGVETIHAPSDAGISGSVATASARTTGGWTLSAVYGRLSISDLVHTETSPEALGGIPVFAQVLSIGAARRLALPHLTGGVAVRALSGRLADAFETRWAVDVGAVYARPRYRFGVATHFFAPRTATSAPGASILFGGEARTAERELWGAPGTLRVRYGATVTDGEGVAHLVSAGLALAGAFEFDVGAAREEVAGEALWRSRAGAAVTAGRYRVYVGRDGGANGFGATYRFGLAAFFP